jgi:hypothetical protein
MGIRTKIKINFYHYVIILLFLLSSNFVYAADNLNLQRKVTIGVFLTSLYELNMNAGSFSADFWIWSESQIDHKFKLDRVELGYLYGKYPLETSLRYQENLGESISFENRKIRATFLHDYSLDLFPFDKQILRIYIEGTDSIDELIFEPSTKSGFSELIQMSGWRINSFKLIPSEINHGTNFGYPNYTTNVSYPLITVEIELIRNSLYLFFKLIIGLFVSVLIASLASSLSVYNDDLYSARLALIGGSLLASVLNQQFVDTKADAINLVTLLDIIHLIGISTVGSLFVSAIIFRFLSEKNYQKIKLQKIDSLFGFIAFALFFSVSLILVVKSL